MIGGYGKIGFLKLGQVLSDKEVFKDRVIKSLVLVSED